jgi:hypothetical protein
MEEWNLIVNVIGFLLKSSALPSSSIVGSRSAFAILPALWGDHGLASINLTVSKSEGMTG